MNYYSIPQYKERNVKDYTVQDLIEYFSEILKEGCVSGTDFELDEDEKEIYRRTILCLLSIL